MVPSEFIFWEQNFKIDNAIARSIASTLALLDVPTGSGTQGLGKFQVGTIDRLDLVFGDWVSGR